MENLKKSLEKFNPKEKEKKVVSLAELEIKWRLHVFQLGNNRAREWSRGSKREDVKKGRFPKEERGIQAQWSGDK